MVLPIINENDRSDINQETNISQTRHSDQRPRSSQPSVQHEETEETKVYKSKPKKNSMSTRNQVQIFEN